MSKVEFRLPSKRRTIVDDLGDFGGKLVTPGDVCTERSNYMRGHGFFFYLFNFYNLSWCTRLVLISNDKACWYSLQL